MNIGVLLSAAWLAASATLLLALKVLQPRQLAQAPLRRGTLTLASVAGVTLVYIGAAAAALIALHALAPQKPPPKPSPLGPLVTTTTAASIPATPKTAPAPVAQTLTRPASASATRRAPRPASAPRSHPTTLSATDLTDTVISQSLDALAKLAAALFGLFLVHQTIKGGIPALGLHPRQLPKGILLGLLAFFIIYPILMVCQNLVEFLWTQRLHYIPTTQPTIQALQSHPPLPLKTAYFLLAGLAAPILEEFYFRGLLQTALAGRSFGLRVASPADLQYSPSPAHRFAAIALTSALFAAAHGSIDIYPTLFLLSLALGYTYERSNNLFASITLHAAFNTFNMLPLLLT
ncbi:MAG TPA: CPBP family intramembrane glutamic endopeptidase [Phycisphaerae bacterium]|nr:CPBP family intramembrane glutamic endopeptidase [Phycisphaerae bacterium]